MEEIPISNEMFDLTTQKSKLKKETVEVLNDYKKPYMISFLTHRETDKITLLKVLADRIDCYREKNEFSKKTILFDLVKRNMIVRRSIKGNGSQQLVDIIKEIVADERIRTNLGNLSGGLLK